ncbi:hypothetical protein DJ71_01625 [Halorubrum sp. E3]|nr:hypothetical protein DJ71_01625 [Halorubrum sp. E3]
MSPRQQRAASRLLQVAIGGILLAGLFTQNLSVLVNAVLALAITFLPAVLKRDYRINLGAGITLWITLALFLHTLGMLGFYGEVWWYDHVTHTLSAAIIAASGYVAARAVNEWSDAIYLPSRFMFVFILLFTLGLGVFWEVLEFATRIGADLLGFDPVLVQYGLDDSLLDLLFDTLGAVIVAGFGTQWVTDLAETLSNRLTEYRGSSHTSARTDSDRFETTNLDAVVRTEPVNARLSWVLTSFLALVIVGGVAAGALLPSVLVAAVLVLALVPVLAYRDPRAMLPWQLLLLASLPVLGTVFASPWLTSGPVTYFAVATIALVVAVELHLFTPVRMTPGFAVLFVIVTTMAVAGVWAVGRWLTDLYFGTELILVSGLTDAQVETRLMLEFVYSAAAGAVAGIIFQWGFRQRSE